MTNGLSGSLMMLTSGCCKGCSISSLMSLSTLSMPPRSAYVTCRGTSSMHIHTSCLTEEVSKALPISLFPALAGYEGSWLCYPLTQSPGKRAHAEMSRGKLQDLMRRTVMYCPAKIQFQRIAGSSCVQLYAKTRVC